MIFATLWLCHCEQRLKYSIFTIFSMILWFSMIFATHLFILLKGFHQIQMFHLLFFICGTGLHCIRLAFISLQSCSSCEEMQLRCTEETICSAIFARKHLCLKQKYLNQDRRPRFWGELQQVNFHDFKLFGCPKVLDFLVLGLGASTNNLNVHSGNCLKSLAYTSSLHLLVRLNIMDHL